MDISDISIRERDGGAGYVTFVVKLAHWEISKHATRDQAESAKQAYGKVLRLANQA